MRRGPTCSRRRNLRRRLGWVTAPSTTSASATTAPRPWLRAARVSLGSPRLSLDLLHGPPACQRTPTQPLGAARRLRRRTTRLRTPVGTRLPPLPEAATAAVTPLGPRCGTLPLRLAPLRPARALRTGLGLGRRTARGLRTAAVAVRTLGRPRRWRMVRPLRTVRTEDQPWPTAHRTAGTARRTALELARTRRWVSTRLCLHLRSKHASRGARLMRW